MIAGRGPGGDGGARPGNGRRHRHPRRGLLRHRQHRTHLRVGEPGGDGPDPAARPDAGTPLRGDRPPGGTGPHAGRAQRRSRLASPGGDAAARGASTPAGSRPRCSKRPSATRWPPGSLPGTSWSPPSTRPTSTWTSTASARADCSRSDVEAVIEKALLATGLVKTVYTQEELLAEAPSAGPGLRAVPQLLLSATEPAHHGAAERERVPELLRRRHRPWDRPRIRPARPGGVHGTGRSSAGLYDGALRAPAHRPHPRRPPRPRLPAAGRRSGARGDGREPAVAR